jgi:hypothetical protein
MSESRIQNPESRIVRDGIRVTMDDGRQQKAGG